MTRDAVLRADANHFGFPGVIEEMNDEVDTHADAVIMEGERNGRKALARARYLLEGVQIRDPTLMGWIHEMVDAGLPD